MLVFFRNWCFDFVTTPKVFSLYQYKSRFSPSQSLKTHLSLLYASPLNSSEMLCVYFNLFVCRSDTMKVVSFKWRVNSYQGVSSSVSQQITWCVLAVCHGANDQWGDLCSQTRCSFPFSFLGISVQWWEIQVTCLLSPPHRPKCKHVTAHVDTL